VGFLELSPFEDFPEGKGDGEKDEEGVVGEEWLDSECAWEESGVAVDKDDNNLKAKRDPGTVWLEVAVIRESLAIKALNFASPVEAQKRALHNDKVDDSSSGDDVGEPCQNFGSAVRQLQEG